MAEKGLLVTDPVDMGTEATLDEAVTLGTVDSAPMSTPNVLPSLEAAAPYNTEQVAKAFQLSSELGRPENLVLDSMNESIKESKAKSIERNKLFAGWAAQSKRNAAIASDDIEGLTPVFASVDTINQVRAISEREKLEEKIKDERRSASLRRMGIPEIEVIPGVPTIVDAIGTVGNVLAQGTFNVADSVIGAALLTSYNTILTAKSLGFDSYADYMTASNEALRKWQREWARDRLQPEQFEEGSFAQYAADVGMMLPQVASQVAVAIGTGGAGAGAFMASQIAGGKYLDLTEKQKVDPTRALYAAYADAAMQTPLEMIGLKGLTNIFKTKGFAQIVQKAVTGSLTEATTEFLQSYPDAATTLYAMAEKEGRSPGETVQQFLTDIGDITRQGLYEGAVALPFGLLGGAGRLATVSRAERFSEAHSNLAKAIEGSKLKTLSPLLMEDALQQNGVSNTYMPAQRVLELYQTSPEYAEAFGISVEKVTEAAAMGQDIEIPTARIISRLSAEQFEPVAANMRESHIDLTVSEAQDETRLTEDTRRVLDHYNEDQRQTEAYNQSVENFRAVLNSAVAETPGLATQATDVDGLVEFYKAFAERNFRSNEARAEFMNRVAVQSAEQARITEPPAMVAEDAERMASLEREAGDMMLPPDTGPLPDLAELGETFTPEEYHALQEQKALMDSLGITQADTEIQRARKLNPWLDNVFGRIDGESLRRDYPDAFKEIVRNYGIGIFKSKAKGGIEIDVLADDLVRTNIFHEGMGADELVERLKTPRREMADLQGRLFQAAQPATYTDESRGWIRWSLETEELFDEEGDSYDGEQYVLLNKLYTSPEYRGQGVARQNMQAALDEIRATHPGLPIRLWSEAQDKHTDTERLAAFYESFGFEATGNGAEMELRGTYSPNVLFQAAPPRSAAPVKGSVVGAITTDISSFLPLNKPGEILLLPENLQHIEEEHGEQIRGLGYANAQEFVTYVLSHVDAVYQGNTNRKFELVARERPPQSRVIARLEFTAEGDHYEIKTAGFVREKYYKNRTPLWERATSTHFQGEIPSATRHALQRGQSGERLNLTMSRENVKTFRGSVSFTAAGGYEITLGPKSDISTLIHETAHIFDAELGRLEYMGLADAQQIADRRTAAEWLARFDDDATLKAEYDKYLKKLPGFGKAFTKLTDAEKAIARDTAKREYFARGMEEYVKEGKAPSEALRGIFSRFAHWLAQIYKKARSLSVELTDEMRGVFDRMLASEQAIEQAAAVNELLELTQKELDALGLKGAEREFQAALLEAAKRKGVDLLNQERNKDRTERIRQWAQEARDELMQDPVYAARAEIRSPDGYLDADAIVRDFGQEALRRLRRSAGPGVARTGGQDLNLFSAQHGFAGVSEMLTAVTEADGIGKRIKDIVAAREAEFDGNIDPAPLLVETAEAARHLELIGEYLARVTAKENLQQRAFNLVANEQLAKMPVREARLYNTFNAAMRRALREERLAIARGDFSAALEANTQARLNMEFARQAREIDSAIKSTTNKAKNFVGRAKSDPAARFFVNDIAARFGMMPYNQRLIGGKDASTIENWLKERSDDGYVFFIDDFAMRGQKPVSELTVDEWGLVSDAITNVITVDKHSGKLLAARGAADFEAAIDGAVNTTFTYRQPQRIPTVEERGFISKGLRRIHASHTKIEALAIMLDGGEALGNNYNLIYRPISDAENRRGVMFKALDARLKGKELFGAYTHKELIDMSRKREYIAAIDESLTKGERIMVALNMGNEGNFDRLRRGHGWTDAQIQEIVSTLDARDWNFVQGIWDTFEGYKADAFALQEKVTGLRPTEVQAMPIRTQYGEFRGGYFPIGYARQHAQIELQDKLINNQNPAFGQSRHGHLQERTRQGAGTPLDLNMGRITSSLYDVITDLAFREAFIDVGRVLKNKKYRHSIESTVGHEQYEAMVNWLKDAAKVNTPVTDGEQIARWARTSATTVSMGLKLTTMIAQPFGITQSIDHIGAKHVMKGLSLAYGGGPRGIRPISDWVKSVSPFMDQRLKSFDRDVSDTTSEFARQSLTPDNLASELATRAGLRRFEKFIKDNAFLPMGIVQYGVDLPTWLGAYQKAIGEGRVEADAIEFADSAVRLSQGGGSLKDLARIQRGGQYAKLFTMFYTYFGSLYNMTSLRVNDVNMNRDAASVIRAANSFLLLYVIPSVFTELAAMRGPEDDEDSVAWAAKQLIMYPFQTVVGVRTLAGMVEAEYGYKGSPAEAAPESLYRLGVALNKLVTDPDTEFNAKKLARVTMRAAGYFAGLPAGQAEISAFNMWDYMDGTTGDFEFRDLFFRKQKSRRGK